MKKIITREDVLINVEEEDVEFVRLQFTDIFGQFKNLAVKSEQIEKVLDNKFVFDSVSVQGFEDSDDADLILRPDCSTYSTIPWRPQQGKVARLICDVYEENGKPSEADSRLVLKRALAHAKEMGYQFQVGPECEFFLFHTDENGLPTTITHEQAGYLDISPLDLGENARRDMVLTLEQMGFEIQASHHELAPAQHEIDFKYDEALAAADKVMTFRMAVKTIAKRHGLHATFMPKPKSDAFGSGMHVHMTLIKDGKNIFGDENGELGLSKEGMYFIGGILKHLNGITAVTNPLVNSYKRFQPNTGAPTVVGWGKKDREQAIRIPAGDLGEKRIELRSPDSAANPYLAFAVLLEAGLEGIREQILPPARYDITTEGLTYLPTTLSEALDMMEADGLAKKVLGETIYDRFLKAKRREWAENIRLVTEWEVNRYLYKY